MAKHYHMRPEAGQLTLTGHDVKLTHTVIERAVKKNWPLISIYAIITIGGIVASYFTANWVSVGVSLAVAVVTFIVSLRMLREVITITNEVR